MLLAIDTSCYTTSWALVAQNGQVIATAQKLLEVPEGGRGLAQSAALFQHMKAGNELFQELWQQASPLQVEAVAASIQPRPLPDSYMPVFFVGRHWGELLASAWQVPFYATSHQEGHIMAGVKTSGMPEKATFLAVHLSGGTSEILFVQTTATGFAITKVGGTKDLAAGQFVDRVGVALNCSFPAGKALDDLALSYQGEKPVIKSYTQGAFFSFSGPETAAQRLVQTGAPAGAVAQSVFTVIANSLEKSLRYAMGETGCRDVLLVGGVAGSQFLKQRLQHRLGKHGQLFFTPPQYAKDNAIGVAWLGLRQKQNAKKGL